MTGDVFSILTEAGPLGIFALYLIWQRQKDSQRMEAQQGNFLKRLDEMEQRSDSSVEATRDRYDKVLDQYNKERGQLMTEIANKLDQILIKLNADPPAPIAVPPPPAVVEPPRDPGMTLQIERKVQEALDKIATKDDDE